jgi:alkane 1-monooxygenase
MNEAAFARYQCPACGHVYDEQRGNPREGFAPGTRWAAIPDDWACPDCAVREKPDFSRLEA